MIRILLCNTIIWLCDKGESYEIKLQREHNKLKGQYREQYFTKTKEEYLDKREDLRTND